MPGLFCATCNGMGEDDDGVLCTVCGGSGGPTPVADAAPPAAAPAEATPVAEAVTEAPPKPRAAPRKRKDAAAPAGKPATVLTIDVTGPLAAPIAMDFGDEPTPPAPPAEAPPAKAPAKPKPPARRKPKPVVAVDTVIDVTPKSTAVAVIADPKKLMALYDKNSYSSSVVAVDNEPSSLLDLDSDVQIPRVSITQGTSGVVADEKLPSGVFYRVDTEQNLGKKIMLIPLGHVQQRMCWDKKELGLLHCGAFQNILTPDYGEKYSERCATCDYAKWVRVEKGDDIPPQCSPVRTLLVLVLANEIQADGSAQALTPFVATIGHHRGQTAVAKKLTTALLAQERQGNNCVRLRVGAQVVSVKGPKGNTWGRAYQVLPGLLGDEELVAQLKAQRDEWMPLLRTAPSVGAESSGSDDKGAF